MRMSYSLRTLQRLFFWLLVFLLNFICCQNHEDAELDYYLSLRVQATESSAERSLLVDRDSVKPVGVISGLESVLGHCCNLADRKSMWPVNNL